MGPSPRPVPSTFALPSLTPRTLERLSLTLASQEVRAPQRFPGAPEKPLPVPRLSSFLSGHLSQQDNP